MSPERSIHEGFKHSGAQHQIGLRMGVAVGSEFIKRGAEWKPLVNPRGELAFLFKFFVDLEVFPIGRIVLGRSHAMRGKIGESNFDSRALLLMGKRRNRLPY